MKKYLFAAAVAILALTSCGSNENKDNNTATEAEQTEQTAQATVTETAAVVELTDDSAYRPDTKTDKLVIIDFNATWCVPCKTLKPVFEAAAKKYADVTFISADIEKCPETANAFGVEAVPTVVFMKGGEMTSFVGTDDLLPAEKLDSLTRKFR